MIVRLLGFAGRSRWAWERVPTRRTWLFRFLGSPASVEGGFGGVPRLLYRTSNSVTAIRQPFHSLLAGPGPMIS